MTDPLSLEELDRRIAIVRDNLRQLIEQAAARSGAADEALASDRIAQQSEELDRLTKERDALLAAKGRKT
jgi:predicted ATPase